MKTWNQTAEELIPKLDALMSVIGTQLAQSTEQLAALATGIRNDALEVGTVTLAAVAGAVADPNLGVWTGSYRVPFGWVSVCAVAPGELVVTNQDPEPTRPADGRGVVIVPAATDGRATSVRLTGQTLTIYGTAGTRVVVQVLTQPAPTGGLPS